MDSTFSLSSSVCSALSDAAAVLAPVSCAGCGRIDRALCPACRAQLVVQPRTVWLHPDEALTRIGSLAVAVSLSYEGVVARVLGAVKEHGRTDVLPALVPPLRSALRRAEGLCDGRRGPPLFVTVPSARRATSRRGFRPVDVLTRRSGRAVRRRPVLGLVRETRDQAGLHVGERQANLNGAMRASGAVMGREVVLVDDVLTTGSTVLEARRAVAEGGGRVIAAACLAYTEKREVTGRELVGDTSGRPY